MQNFYVHAGAFGGWTLRRRDTPAGPPSLSVFPAPGARQRPPLRRYVGVDGGGAVWLLRLPGHIIRWHRAGRRCLWGARRGDWQLARRTGVELASQHHQGLPAGATCIGAERACDAYWFWIPVS